MWDDRIHRQRPQVTRTLLSRVQNATDPSEQYIVTRSNTIRSYQFNHPCY